MGRRLPTGAILVLLIVLAVAGGGGATTLRPLPFGEIARRSDRIVVATAGGSSCRLAATTEGRVRPFTDIQLEDISEVAGSVPTRNLVLSVVGGTVEGRTTRVDGTPRLVEGRRYVLFMKDAEPFCGLTGWTQGAFRVVSGPDGVDRVFTWEGEPVASVAGGRISRAGTALSLGEFLQAVWAARAPRPAPLAPDPVAPRPEDGK